MTKISGIQNSLIKASRSWALKQHTDLTHVREMRHEAVLLNHAHYMENISLYRNVAIEEGCEKDIDINIIQKRLMLSTDIFKSYDRSWLDNSEFDNMTQWLTGIYHRYIDADMSEIKSIDDWIDRLETAGVHVVYSSGTSGAFSFIPRDIRDWDLSRTANIAGIAPLLINRMGSTSFDRLSKSTAPLMSPESFSRLVVKKRLTDFDAVFLGFRKGRMGNQVLMEELVPLFRRHYFLYDMDIPGTALRCLHRGASTDEELRLITELQDEVVHRKEANYLKLVDAIHKSTDDGQKVFIFGAPYQFKELCEMMDVHNRRPALRNGSFIFFGGGWKSFAGETIDRETLVDMLSRAFGIPPEMILEGYSMTETNMLMIRCPYGRFHIPPLIEPVIFDEQLEPVRGTDITGAFGFLDPLAVSYPGFLISGDYVHMIDGECDCGLCGPAITEIGRMPGSEVKGCGGIMGSMKA